MLLIKSAAEDRPVGFFSLNVKMLPCLGERIVSPSLYKYSQSPPAIRQSYQDCSVHHESVLPRKLLYEALVCPIPSSHVVQVLLVVASVQCEAEADAYTFRQVAYGLTNGGFITGVDYGHGLVTGYGALGNRGHYGHYPGLHYYGKREAEAGAAPYTPYQVAAGLPVANAFATGHPHNVGYVAYTSYPSTGYRHPYYFY